MNSSVPYEQRISALPNDRIIAIDGTSGSGKTTVTRGLGKVLDLPVLETGSLYRAVTLLSLEANVDVHDEQAALAIARDMDFHYDGAPLVGDRDITQDVRSADVVDHVSYVSSHEKVRAVLTSIMQDWIEEHGGGIVEGRDITTVVAPHARIRIFVDAPAEVRAARRSEDKDDSASTRTQADALENITLRDRIDSTRAASPLYLASGVLEIDSSTMTPDQIIEMIVHLYRGEQD